MTMEAVQQFNQEMTSLYEVKPPISKAKMTSITKGAIRAIKFYKHVVQSVEKFIQKCKPEYKIPGLYVIDSIVRQSRHQFGPDKDVFAPRFLIDSYLFLSSSLSFSSPPCTSSHPTPGLRRTPKLPSTTCTSAVRRRNPR